MDRYTYWLGTGILLLCLAVGAQETEPKAADAAPAKDAPTLSEGELDQLVAPIALHPDELLSQILMASTYPLEVVQANRWAKANKLDGDAKAQALEKEPWDPSVKSLVNFPEVLEMMDTRLDWTQRLGNAFLAQQADVMKAVQRLRQKALAEGNLKDSKEQTIDTEGTSIVILPADPEVIYVPVYNTSVVYGTWPYPAYPPYYYYPPSYPRPTLYGFAAGVAVGVAWGYAWGHCSWGNDAHVDIDINRNIDVNRNIDRANYQKNMQRQTGATLKGGKGTWQHNPTHRQGVAYPNNSVAQRYNRGASSNAGSRDAYRGRTQPSTRPAPTARPSTTRTPSSRPSTTSTPSARPNSTAFSSGGSGSRSSAQRSSSRGYSSRQSAGRAPSGGSRGGGGGRR